MAATTVFTRRATMPQTTVTSAFNRYKAQEAAGGRRVVLDEFVFANIPGLDAGNLPPDSEGMPDEEYIVYRQNIDRGGMVNADTVVYTVTLPSTAGNFTFNWMALINSESGTPAVITYLSPQQKIKNEDGVQGNVLTYSEYMRYTGASTLTGITTPVSTWQIDFTARLHGMDEATRSVALDLYGSALFFDDGFKLTATATPGLAELTPGTAYLRGLRVALDNVATLTFETGKEQVISLDSVLSGSLTGENRTTFTLINHETADYTDSLGFRHYVEPVARIAQDGAITDLRRTGSPVNERLDGEFLSRKENLADVPDKAMARQSLELGSSATLNVGTTTDTVAAGDDDRITGAMQKSQNGADIPDKPAFIEHLGMKETLNPTKRVSIGNIGTGAFDGSIPCINIGDSDSGFIGSADGVIDIYCNNGRVGYIDGNGLHMLTDIHFNNARMTTNGDIFSSVWGNNWLSIWMTNQLNTRGTIDWINSQLSERDKNINARATIDYVNQIFARKNTASLAVNGWFRDESTGWIFQWGITPFAGSTTITVSLPIPFPVQGFLALGGPADALWYGEDDNSSYASLLNNSQLKVTTDTNVGTAWIALGR
ncbi:hypothetical protein FYE32_09630 [Salmonella enterica]|nr:hypothetical protein [Salmonella enterica]